MNIQDSVVFVTGANRGLGLAFAQEALKRGARKVYAGVRRPGGASTPGIVQVQLDVTDAASVAAAAEQCGDITLLVNNAGIASLTASTLAPDLIDASRQIFETNYYGMIRVSQAFAPVLARHGGGAVINVLSDATWHARTMLAAYAASKSAAWGFTNAFRLEVRAQRTAVLAVHASWLDTDMARGLENVKKTSAQQAARISYDGLEAGKEEVLVDDFTRALKLSLSSEQALYLDPPPIA